MNENERLYKKATELIPWGTQTNAKRLFPDMDNQMPAFIEQADGCRIKDVDGRWYIDYRCSLGPIILGYRYPEVDKAVRAQMKKGVLFSMASPLEIDVAELLVDMIPGIEQVRFMKTGNDANSAAIRLARAYTGRDRIATCGYHGYADWFSCGTGRAPSNFPREGNGVPKALDSFVTRLPYGDIDALHELFDEHADSLAAVITVPYDWNELVGHEFLKTLRELCDKNGTVLIFDQVLTGFRLAKGGAQEYFGVIPDLSTYAKAMANGYPLSAYTGKKEIMQKLNDVIITTTYAGETLSLAASKATLTVMNREPVQEYIWKMGKRLMGGFDTIAAEMGISYRTFGLPPAIQFHFDDDPAINNKLQTIFFRELFRGGIFATRPFLISYSHQPGDIDETIEVMRHALTVVAENDAIHMG